MNLKDNPKVMLPLGIVGVAALKLSSPNPGMWIFIPAITAMALSMFWLMWRAAVSFHHGVEYFDYNPWPFEQHLLGKLRARRLNRLGPNPLCPPSPDRKIERHPEN
jgi:hypothetical protein